MERSHETRYERWPELADESTATGCTVMVYKDVAWVELPLDDPDDHGQLFTEGELRALATELTWAADRLAAR